MKTLFFGITLSFAVLSVSAQIQGPLSGSTFSVLAIPGSSGVWANPANASSSDNVYSNFGNLANPGGTYTDYLVATNFGFTIPSGVTINGIVVEVERADPNFRTADYSIRIIKGGSLGATEKSVGSGYPSTDSYQSYGNAGDLWGETWTFNDINAADFGVAIAAQRNSAGGTTAGRIDHIRIFVFYDFIILPIRLINFHVVKSGNNVNIKWITAEEVDINHYEVERSANAREFTSIETVTSLNQFIQKTYAATDKNPLSIKSFYRLKIVENSGVVKYSKVIAFDPGKENVLTLYPLIWKKGTPLIISNFTNEKIEISFFNVNGQLISRSFTNSNQIATDPLNKVNGILFYKLINTAGKFRGSGKIIVD